MDNPAGAGSVIANNKPAPTGFMEKNGSKLKLMVVFAAAAITCLLILKFRNKKPAIEKDVKVEKK